MSLFDSLFADGFAALAAVCGESVSYVDLDGSTTAAPGAIVDDERIEERDSGRGKKHVAVREVALLRSVINAPLLTAGIVVGGKTYSIAAQLQQDATTTKVRIERTAVVDRAPGKSGK